MMPTAPPSRSVRKLSTPAKSSARKGNKPSDAKKNAPQSDESKAQEAMTDRFTKKTGISAESLQKAFDMGETGKEKASPEKIVKLIELIRDRIKDGRRLSLKDWRVHAAVDEAYAAPFNQISPTLIGKILDGDKKLTPTEIIKELNKWGLSEDTLFTEIPNPKDTSKKVKILNRETFTKVLLPIVKSYLNARESKLYMERNNNPFFVYSPTQSTEEATAIGEIITQIVETMVTQYGLKSVLRAAIHQALKYSFAMMFPAEAWHYDTDVDEKGEEFTSREGLRYNLPHPTRCTADPNYRPGTLNTDTGCEWALYWGLNRFSAIDTNPVFYNKAKVNFGTMWFGAYQTYFENVYPCTMEFPHGAVIDSNSNDREKQATLYTSNDGDKAVFLTNIFMKLSPKEWGIGEWKHKIWIRFVVANDDVIVYAEPVPYRPVLFMGSDADDNTSSRTASFALETVPWQDLTGNLLKQHLIALRQNCVKIIPYDKKQVTEGQIREIEARGKESVNVIWLPYDPRDARVAQVDPANMFKVVHLPQVSTAEIINTLMQVFTLIERALGLSAQEVGSIAGHTQTAKEIDVISGNQSNRVEFIGTFIDDFVDAWKRQILDAAQAFMDEEFVVYVNGVKQEVADKLKKEYNFKLGKASNGKIRVEGNKTKLSIDAFISTREGKLRQNNSQTAALLLQTLQIIASNPELSQKIGVEQILKRITRAEQLGGAPEDSELKVLPEATLLAELKEVRKQIDEFAKELLKGATQAATQTATQQATQQATEGAVKTVAQEISPVIKDLQQQTASAAQTAQGATALATETATVAADAKATLEQLIPLVLQLKGVIDHALSAPPEPMMDAPVNGPVILPPEQALPVAQPVGMV